MKILLHPDPKLREVATSVKRVDADFIRKIDEMRDLMLASEGVGLAAIQVGWPVRMFITKDSVFINPMIACPSPVTDVVKEGCLSLPGRIGKVRRPVRVHLACWTLEGKEIRGEVDGDFARIVLHEIDHLNGILFIDKI